MTSSNEPGQPVGYMTPPAQGDNTFDGGGTLTPPSFTPPNAQPGLNTMAVLALVFAFVFSPLGIVFGVIGRRQISRTGERGKGLATAGLILGVVGLLLGILFVVVGVRVANSSSSVSKSALESQVGTQYEATVGTRPDSVSCATDLAATVGATDTCTITASGTALPVRLEVTSVVDKTVKFDIKAG